MLRFTASKLYLSDTRMWYYGREQNDSYHPPTPQTALPETTLMSHRWSLLKPLAKGRILIGVICISWQPPQIACFHFLLEPLLCAGLSLLGINKHAVTMPLLPVPAQLPAMAHPTLPWWWESNGFLEQVVASPTPQLSAVLFWLPATLASQGGQFPPRVWGTGSSLPSPGSLVKVHLLHHSYKISLSLCSLSPLSLSHSPLSHTIILLPLPI